MRHVKNTVTACGEYMLNFLTWCNITVVSTGFPLLYFPGQMLIIILFLVYGLFNDQINKNRFRRG